MISSQMHHLFESFFGLSYYLQQPLVSAFKIQSLTGPPGI